MNVEERIKELGIELPISSVFDSPTIAELAERVKTLRLTKKAKEATGESLAGEREEIEI